MKFKAGVLAFTWVALTSLALAGGGGGGPDPLTLFNEHVELADSEYYLLVGKIVLLPVFQGSSHKLQPYFEVDMTQHPWLAGKFRRAKPLYLLEASAASWKAWEGVTVKLASRAHAQIIFSESGSAFQMITLRPIIELSVIPYQGELSESVQKR